MFYDSPHFNVRQAAHFLLAAGSAATEANKFVAHANLVIKNISGACIVAGTNDGAGWTLNKNGTSSIGFLTAGTVAADGTYTQLTTDISLSEGETIAFDRVATHGATMAGVAVVDYEIAYGATID